MRHPLWLLNTLLVLLIVGVCTMLLLLRPHAPRTVSFLPTVETRSIHKEIAKIDLNKIYINDLFDTYKTIQKIEPKPTEQESSPLPPPPQAVLSTKPPTPSPKFLEPLKIQVRGVIISSDEEYNIAIIENNKDKQAKNYRIGDIIEDAQLIRILKNKVILIRANGQQESLFVNQHDAEIELLLTPANWKQVIINVGENTYAIDPDLFLERVRSISQLIDQLNITSVYHKGKSIGCRIGKFDPNAIGAALGLQQGDIIEMVNGIPTASAQDRLDIYNAISTMKLHDIIHVQVIRQGKTIELVYKLEKAATAQPDRPVTMAPMRTPEQVEKERINTLKEKEKFAPTAQEIYKKEKENIRNLLEQKKHNVLSDSVKS